MPRACARPGSSAPTRSRETPRRKAGRSFVPGKGLELTARSLRVSARSVGTERALGEPSARESFWPWNSDLRELRAGDSEVRAAVSKRRDKRRRDAGRPLKNAARIGSTPNESVAANGRRSGGARRA